MRIEPQKTPDDVAEVEDDATYVPPLRAGSQLPMAAAVRELRRTHEKPLAVAVEALLRRMGIEASPWLEDLAAAWPQLAGDVAAKSRPAKFHNGILFVHVRNSTDLFAIRRNQLPAIERAVKKFAGNVEVRQVRLMIGDIWK